MTSVAVYRTSAFTTAQEGGNEAGVILKADGLDSKTMQSIAKTIGYSETAFIQSVKDGAIKVRYFTPKAEVPICGHATIALLNLLRQTSLLRPGTYTLITPAASFPVKVSSSDATLIFPEPRIMNTYAPERIATSLSLNPDILNGYPFATIDAGVKELYIGIKDADLLASCAPDREALIEISDSLGVSGIVFYTTASPDALAVMRNFLPAIGIGEESATGTAAAALSKLLYTFHAPFNEGVIRQGKALGKPSLIHVSIQKDASSAYTVEISGKFRVIDTVDVTL